MLIKQDKIDQWAEMPGSLGYDYQRDISAYYIDMDATKNEGRAVMASEDQYSVSMRRDFSDLAYAPTSSVVDYGLNYTYNMTNVQGKRLSEETVTTPNWAALSAWKQSMGHGRADFVKAFQALTQLVERLGEIDIYGRFLAYNMYHYGYKEMANVQEYARLDAEVADAVFNDETYGMSTISGLYEWVRAFAPGDAKNPLYTTLEAYFTDKLGDKFTPDTMKAIVGPKSMMQYLNRTFAFRLAEELDYDGLKVTPEAVIADQWGGRRLSKSKKVLLFVDDSVAPLESI